MASFSRCLVQLLLLLELEEELRRKTYQISGWQASSFAWDMDMKLLWEDTTTSILWRRAQQNQQNANQMQAILVTSKYVGRLRNWFPYNCETKIEITFLTYDRVLMLWELLDRCRSTPELL